jgi:hypothetical protein
MLSVTNHESIKVVQISQDGCVVFIRHDQVLELSRSMFAVIAADIPTGEWPELSLVPEDQGAA